MAFVFSVHMPEDDEGLVDPGSPLGGGSLATGTTSAAFKGPCIVRIAPDAQSRVIMRQASAGLDAAFSKTVLPANVTTAFRLGKGTWYLQWKAYAADVDATYTVAPTISGTARQGSKLTGVSGTYANGYVTKREWVRGSTVVATGAEYYPTAEDVGATLTYRETVSGSGADAVGTSAATVAVAAPADRPVLAVVPAQRALYDTMEPGAHVAAITGVPAGAQPTLDVPPPYNGMLVVAGDETNGWRIVVGMKPPVTTAFVVAVKCAGAIEARLDVIRPEPGLPRPGDMVYSRGLNINRGLVYGVAAGFQATAGKENIAWDDYIPPLPVGSRLLLDWWWLRGPGNNTESVERKPANNGKLLGAVVLPDQAGASVIGTVAFTERGATLTPGYTLISDPIGFSIASRSVVRMATQVATNAYRPSGRAFKASGLTAQISAVQGDITAKLAGGTLNGTGVFNSDFPQCAGALVPFEQGMQIVAGFGTSIMFGEDATYRYINDADDAYGWFAKGMESNAGGASRYNFYNFALNAAALTQQIDGSPEGQFFGYRHRRNQDIAKSFNGGRWPFNIMLLDSRNDVASYQTRTGYTWVSAQDCADKNWAELATFVAGFKALYPGVECHVCTVPTIGITSTDGYTSLAGQTVSGGNLLPTGLVILNNMIRTRYAELGAAGFVDTADEFCEVDSGIQKWKRTVFTKAGGGTVATQANVGTNLLTTGIDVTIPAGTPLPEIGDYLVLDPGTANFEISSKAGGISSVTLVSGTTYNIKVNGSSATGFQHNVGAVVRTSSCRDGTHPSHGAHARAGNESGCVTRWKLARQALQNVLWNALGQPLDVSEQIGNGDALRYVQSPQSNPGAIRRSADQRYFKFVISSKDPSGLPSDGPTQQRVEMTSVGFNPTGGSSTGPDMWLRYAFRITLKNVTISELNYIIFSQFHRYYDAAVDVLNGPPAQINIDPSGGNPVLRIGHASHASHPNPAYTTVQDAEIPFIFGKWYDVALHCKSGYGGNGTWQAWVDYNNLVNYVGNVALGFKTSGVEPETQYGKMGGYIGKQLSTLGKDCEVVIEFIFDPDEVMTGAASPSYIGKYPIPA